MENLSKGFAKFRLHCLDLLVQNIGPYPEGRELWDGLGLEVKRISGVLEGGSREAIVAHKAIDQLEDRFTNYEIQWRIWHLKRELVLAKIAKTVREKVIGDESTDGFRLTVTLTVDGRRRRLDIRTIEGRIFSAKRRLAELEEVAP